MIDLRKLLITLLVISCSVSAISCPDNSPQDGGDSASGENSSESTSENEESEISRDWPNGINAVVAEKTLDFLEMFGYEESVLSVTRTDLVPRMETIGGWQIHVESQSGSRMDLGYVENTDIFEYFSYMDENQNIFPPALRQGEDALEKVVELLGILDRGYEPGPEVEEMSGKVYRKYVEAEGYKIRVGEIVLIKDPIINSLQYFEGLELELPEDFEIRITEDEAVRIAKADLPDPEMEHQSVEIILLPDADDPEQDVSTFWEIKIQGFPIYVRTREGTVMDPMMSMVEGQNPE